MTPLVQVAAVFLALYLPSQEVPQATQAQSPAAEAESLWSAGRRVESIERLAHALEISPKDRFLRRRLVEREMAVHRYASALEHMADMGRDAQSERAIALNRLGRFEESAELLDTLDPDQLLLLIATLQRLGRHDDSDRWLKRAHSMLGADDPRVQVLDARRLARLGRYADVLPIVTRVLASDPYDAEALFLQGQALARTGDREAGLVVLERHRALAPLLDDLDFAERGVDIAPLHAPNHARVADVERAIGRLERAEVAYARALELATPDELAPIALRAARLSHEEIDTVVGKLRVE
jgi:tetratricopeptide (TPR) repeat protein